MTGLTDILYCHSGDFTPWTVAACPARNYGPRECSPKSDVDNPADRETERQGHRHIRSTGPHYGLSDPFVEIYALRHWTPTLVIVIVIAIISSIKNIEYKYKYRKRPADGRTDG